MQKGDVAGLVIVGGVIIALGLFFAFAKDASRITYKPVEITGSSILALPPKSPEKVLVGTEVKQNGFVTVHMSHGGAPGPIVGVSHLLTPGSYPNLEIVLDEPINDIDSYIVLLMVDDGDGVYEAGIDLPVMSEGTIVKQTIPL